jgi:CubicO group peptidase (beta-lactamase class C family)
MRVLLAALLLALPAAAAPDAHILALAAGYKAAFICSGRWNAGQTVEQITVDDLTGIYPQYQPLLAGLDAVVDEGARTVSVKFANDLPPRIARWRPLLGCVTLPVGAADRQSPAASGSVPALAPGLIEPDRAALDAQPWPLGDAQPAVPRAQRLPKARAAALDALLAAAFAGDFGSTRTTAVLVLANGRIVAEQYRPGWTMHTPQRTWSVAKSLTASLVGRAVQLGLIDVTAPAAVPEWQAPGDPRAAITTEQLLRMNSGLWTAGPGNRTDEVYLGGGLLPQQAATQALEHAPGSHFNYSNNDIMLAAYGLGNRLGGAGQHAALAFPFTELLWPLGMTRTTPETDWRGNFILSSQVWMTARDMARLALLVQNDGMVGNLRLLPPGWRDFVTRPAGTQPQGRGGEGYGAGFWRLAGVQGLPADTIAMNGNRGQYAVLVPGSATRPPLVVVRRGFDLPGQALDYARFAAAVQALWP